jgi:D-lactate dehydrogenase (cytochrome)
MRAVNRYSKLDLCREAHPVLRVPRHPRRRRRTGPSGPGDRRRTTAAGPVSSGPTRAEERTACGRPGTTPTMPPGLRPGAKGWSPTDVCVPISRLAECIAETKKDIEEAASFFRAIVGHVGDGNFHVGLLHRPRAIRRSSPEAEAPQHPSRRARLAMDGTCTGEHGVGHRQDEISLGRAWRCRQALMASLKLAVDPQGIMNPGKMAV